MTESEIEHEIDRVASLVREYLEDADLFCEQQGHGDLRVQTWMIGAVCRATDSDEDTVEFTSGAYESTSRAMQVGIAVKLSDQARGL